MSEPKTLTKRQQAKAERLRAELNTAMEHLYQSYRGLNGLVLADDLGDVYSMGQYVQTERLCMKLFDLWLEGATLITQMQHSLATVQGITKLEKEGR